MPEQTLILGGDPGYLDGVSQQNCATFCLCSNDSISLSNCYTTTSNCCCLSLLFKSPSVPNSWSQTGPGSLSLCVCEFICVAFLGSGIRVTGYTGSKQVLIVRKEEEPSRTAPHSAKFESWRGVGVHLCLHTWFCVHECIFVRLVSRGGLEVLYAIIHPHAIYFCVSQTTLNNRLFGPT